MANTNAPFGFKLYRQLSGLSPSLDYGVLGGTVSIGDALVWSSGTLVIHTAAADEKIVGVAQANGVSGDRIPFIPVTENQIWTAQMTTYTEATHKGNVYELSGTTGAEQVNAAGTTKPIVRVLGLVPPPRAGYETGAYAVVLCAFVADAYGRSGTVTN
jgi:hypothetical protein